MRRYIPPGTAFLMPPYAHHLDPRNFSLPDTFWPERWLVASGSLSLAHALALVPSQPVRGTAPAPAPVAADTFAFVHDENAFLAFSHGPMNCVAKNFAMMEMRIVVCALVQRFRFRLADGYDPREYERDFKDYLVGSRPALPVVVEVRE